MLTDLSVRFRQVDFNKTINNRKVRKNDRIKLTRPVKQGLHVTSLAVT